jgi:hypothetical protein
VQEVGPRRRLRVGGDGAVASGDRRVADACGIDRQQPLVVRFEWQEPTHYMGACPSPARHTLEVRQSRDAGALDGRARLASWSQFGLWWTLEQRIAEHLQSGWQRYAGAAQQVAERVKREVELLTPQVRDILDMFEWPFTDRALVERALALANGDADAALNLLFDDARERELRAELGPAPTAAGSAVAAKLTLDKADSIYWATVEFVRATLVDIAKRCVICNAPHALELQKPTICANQLCSFQFTSLGLGVDVERELQRAPEVVDLLICFTAAGTLQPERFSPFPDVQRRVAGHEMSFAQNHADLSAALCRLPPVAEMAALAARAPGALRAHLDALHPLLYLALRWIVSTTLAHLERLADHTAPPRWPRLGAHQFIMRCATPAREAQFRDHCRKHGGSFFVWHGSGLGNWHNIVRSGLKNMSGTAMQSTGAAYGAGTYASHDSAISFSYSGNTSNPWSNTMFGVGARTLALCEVVDHGSKLLCLGKVHRPGCIHSPSSPYYRVEDDEFIATRFFIVFMNNEGTASVDAKDAYEFFSKYLKE